MTDLSQMFAPGASGKTFENSTRYRAPMSGFEDMVTAAGAPEMPPAVGPAPLGPVPGYPQAAPLDLATMFQQIMQNEQFAGHDQMPAVGNMDAMRGIMGGR